MLTRLSMPLVVLSVLVCLVSTAAADRIVRKSVKTPLDGEI